MAPIKVLSMPLREAVRLRPGMYFGATDAEAQNSLIWEVVGNAVDQALAGAAHNIHITLEDSHTVRVRDDGPGITVLDEAGLIDLLTQGHDAPTRDGHQPHVHVGRPHGVGLACVTAASSRFSLRSRGTDIVLEAQMSDGIVDSAVVSRSHDSGPIGVDVRLEASRSIFQEGWDQALLCWRVFELACLLPDTAIYLQGRRVAGQLSDLLPGAGGAAPTYCWSGETEEQHRVRLAYRRVPRTGRESTLLTYVNLASLPGRGSLWQAVHDGLERTGTRPHQVHMVIDLWHPAPRFAGPCRDELDQPEIVGPVSRLVRRAIAECSAAGSAAPRASNARG